MPWAQTADTIVDADLWDAVQAQLAAKAPPRTRKTNQPQHALLRGLLTDPHGRPMAPTYGSNKVRRYAYYETRKDLARPGDPPGLRFQRGQLEQHLINALDHMLNDEHALRRLSGIAEAGQLRTLFATAHLLSAQLRDIAKCEQAVRSLITAIAIRSDSMALSLNPAALDTASDANWSCTLPLPTRRPYREARLRIDSATHRERAAPDLLALLADAMAAQRLVLASPELSLNQLAQREGRCRTQLARLLRLSWLSPRIVEAIADGTQPAGLTRRALLICDMPVDWSEQERQFGFAA